MSDQMVPGSIENLGSSGSDSTSGGFSNESAQSFQQPVQNQQSAKYFTQDQIDRIVQGAKSQAYNKAVEETKREYESRMSQSQQAPQNFGQQNQSYLTPDQVRQMAREEAQNLSNAQSQHMLQMQQKEYENRVVSAITSGKEKYPDMFEKLAEVGSFEGMRNIPMLLGHVDNIADVAYELANNPAKLMQIEQAPNPAMGLSMLKKVSESIKQNQSSLNSQRAPAPLESIKHSNVNVGNGDIHKATPSQLGDMLRNMGY